MSKLQVCLVTPVTIRVHYVKYGEEMPSCFSVAPAYVGGRCDNVNSSHQTICSTVVQPSNRSLSSRLAPMRIEASSTRVQMYFVDGSFDRGDTRCGF